MRAAHRRKAAGDAALGHYGSNQIARRHVESRIVYFDVTGRHALRIMGLGHFGRIALLDRDGGAGRTVRIDRRCRPEHIERDAVMAGQHGDADVPILLAASPFAAIRSQPTSTACTRPSLITSEAMLSQISVTSIPALISS